MALRELRANSLFTMLQTWLRGHLVGVDDYGNRYYRERGALPGGGSGAGWCTAGTPSRPWCRPAGSVGCTSGSRRRRASSRCRRNLGEGAAAQPDRDRAGLPAAGRPTARRPARAGDRRLRGRGGQIRSLARAATRRWKAAETWHPYTEVLLPLRADPARSHRRPGRSLRMQLLDLRAFRFLHWYVAPEQVRLLTERQRLSTYVWRCVTGGQHFCPTCGIAGSGPRSSIRRPCRSTPAA